MSRSMYDKLNRRFGVTDPDSEVSAAAAALIEADQKLWSSSLSAECRSKLSKTRVAIVGGGFAGMMAAWSLCGTDKKIEVVVFEAGADIGGRVWSNDKFTKGPRTIEFGAELVGANHPLWLQTARELGVGLMTRTGESHYEMMQLGMKLRIDGRDIPDQEAKKMTEDMKSVFVDIGNDAMQIKNPAEPWNELHPATLDNLKKFDNMSVEQKLDSLQLKKVKPLAYRGMHLLLENNLVTPLEKINYLALLCLVKAGRMGTDENKKDEKYLGFWHHTEEFRCSDGCQTLLKKMVGSLSDPSQKYKFTLLTNTEVRQIECDSATSPKPVKLRWASTKKVQLVDDTFDYIILAVPPSVWVDIAVTPMHPKEIGSIQLGPAVKFFSNLRDRFWIEQGVAPSGISSDIGMIWEGTDNQMHVGKFAGTPPKETFPDSEIELSVFAGGPATASRDGAYYKRELGKLYPPKSGSGGYEKANRLKKTQLVSWPTTKFIRTGYSCPKLGHIFDVAPVLHKAFNERLFFAGEHTQTDFFGFMEGALQSGRRAAAAVISKVCPGSFPNFPNA